MSAVPKHHLAQLNVARPRFPIDDPRMAGFMSMLDEVNAIADASPGFKWRLVSDGANDATELRATVDDGEQMINMSVWEDREALRDYVYRSGHLDLLRRRAEWFEAPSGSPVVLWWIPAGHRPTIDEAVERLTMLRSDGPSPDAFTFSRSFEAPA
jgi:hypothetical protein